MAAGHHKEFLYFGHLGYLAVDVSSSDMPSLDMLSLAIFSLDMLSVDMPSLDTPYLDMLMLSLSAEMGKCLCHWSEPLIFCASNFVQLGEERHALPTNNILQMLCKHSLARICSTNNHCISQQQHREFVWVGCHLKVNLVYDYG